MLLSTNAILILQGKCQFGLKKSNHSEPISTAISTNSSIALDPFEH